MKPLFSKHLFLGARLFLCVLLSIVLMTIDRKVDYLESVRSHLSSIIYPVQYLVNLPLKFGDWMSVSFDTRENLLKENEKLKAQNLLLKTHTHKYQSLVLENQRLRGLIEAPIRQGERVLVADVMGVEMDSTTRKFVLNKGSKQGVFLGQPIIDSQGIMGQIVHVGQASSTGMMVTDEEHAVPVEVIRSGIRAIATGESVNAGIRLDYVPPESDVKEGDLLVSTGIGGHFPKGYPVGTVKKVTLHPGDSFMKVKVTPVANLTKTREVLLIWPGISEAEQTETGKVARK